MKKLFLFVTTIALALASCSNDEDLGIVDNGISETIEFRSLTDRSSNLRAAVTNETNILSFMVTGIKSYDNGYLFNAFGVTRGEDENWDYTPKRYWPADGTVDFYAYSPASSKNVSAGITGYVPGTSITYTVPQVSETNAQEDFLVTKITGQDKNTGAVKLNFHHALSRIMFFAKTTQKDITYTIHEVKLLNLNTTGDLDISSADIAETGSLTYGSTPLVVWTGQTNMSDYAVDMGKSPIYLLNEYESILGKTGAMLVIPQTTTISSNGTGKDAPDPGEFAIEVSYRAFAGGIDYVGSAGNPVKKYFAVKDLMGNAGGITFEMGRQYNFYLGFGEDVSGEITFEVGVGKWSETPNTYIPELNNYFGIISNDLAKKANSAFDPLNNAIVTYEQIQAVTSLTVNAATFDFTGLEYFKKLTSISVASVTNNADLDASKNALLTNVSITNSKLGAVNLSNGTLSTLTFSGNNTVTSLDASNNELTTIDLSTGTITGSLNLSNNVLLTSVNLTNANITGALNLSNCNLQDGSVTITSGNIGSLDLSNNKFTTLDITYSTFANLNISNNAALTTLNIPSVAVSGELNARGNVELANITLKDGNITPASRVVIQNFDISNSTKLERIRVYYNHTIDTLIVWNGCTWEYLKSKLTIHTDTFDGEVRSVKTADGTVLK